MQRICFSDLMVKLKDRIYSLIHIQLREMKDFEIKSICLGDYIQWDIKKHVEILKKKLDGEVT